MKILIRLCVIIVAFVTMVAELPDRARLTCFIKGAPYFRSPSPSPSPSALVLEIVRPYLPDPPVHLPQAATDPVWRIGWASIGVACGIEDEMTAELKKQLRPTLDAIIR